MCSGGACVARVVVSGDAGMTTVDAGGPVVTADSGMVSVDAGRNPGDAGQEPFDAGQVAYDAGQPPFDAGQPPFDAGQVPYDAGQPPFDAGQPPYDAGQPPFDAGQPPFDAGQPPFDAGGPFDAGQPDAGDPFDAGMPDAGNGMCRVMTGFFVADQFGVYSRSPDGGLEHAIAYMLGSPMAPYANTLELDVYWAFTGHQTGVVIPAVRDLAIEPNYSTCTSCVVIREDCPSLDSCARGYFARAGTISLEEVTRGTPGNFKATLSNVRLDQWQLGPDQPMPNGDCIMLQSATIDVSHN